MRGKDSRTSDASGSTSNNSMPDRRGPTSASSPKQPRKSGSREQSAKTQTEKTWKTKPKKKSGTERDSDRVPEKEKGKDEKSGRDAPAVPSPAGQSKNPPIDVSAAGNSAAPELSPSGYPIRNTSELAQDFDCDRAVILKYVRKHKIKPFREREKLKEYELTPQLESILEEEIGNPKLGDVRLEDAQISKETKRFKLDKLKGRAVDFTEACEYFGLLLKGLYTRFDTYPTTAAPRIHKLKTTKEVSSALRRDFRKIFGEFRADPGKFAK